MTEVVSHNNVQTAWDVGFARENCAQIAHDQCSKPTHYDFVIPV